MSIAQFYVREPKPDSWVPAAVRNSLLTAAALLTLLASSTPLLAQTSSGATATAPTSTTAEAPSSTTTFSTTSKPKAIVVAQADTAAPADQTAQGGAAAGEQLQEVTVTAERVESSEQRTPISISVVSSQELTQQNIVSSDALRGLVPSLNILTQGGGGAGSLGNNEMQIYIRGVGTANRFFNTDSGVGVYIDDVYLADTQNLNLSFFDLQNVQVLEGPQGTLFGRNTLGGAVLLYTNPPAQQFGGYAQARVGSFNRLDTEGAVNMPFSDVLTSRFNFYTSNVDGYITHLDNSGTNDDIHEKTARYQVHFQPNSAFTADLMTEYGASDDDGNEEITVGCNPKGYYITQYDSFAGRVPYCTQYAPLGKPYEVYGNTVSAFPEPTYAYNASGATIVGPSGLTSSAGGRAPFDTGTMATVALRLSWIVNDDLTLKSITGLRRSDLDSYRDDGTPVGIYTEQDDYWDENYSEELQALGKLWGGRLNLVGGVFYYLDDAASIQDTGPDYDDPLGYYFGNPTVEHSFAIYAQGTLAITDKLSLIGGLRHTNDYKTSSSQVWEQCNDTSYVTAYTTGAGGCWTPGPLYGDYATASGEWNHTDPRVQLQYQWTPDIMTYASASSGYEAGGFNSQLPGPGSPYNLPFQQETMWNYEAGLKTEFFDHRLRFNVDGFDEIFDNYQYAIQEYVGNVEVHSTSSAADAHERGVETELDVIPIDNLTISANFSTLGEGFDAIFPAAQLSATNKNGLSKNAQLGTAPNRQASVTANYTFHLVNGATVVPNVNWRFEGNFWSGTYNYTYPAQYLAPSYGLLGANLAYNAPGGKWSIAYWCTNCTNKYYYLTYASQNPEAIAANTEIGIQQVTPGRPREMGALFRWNF